MTIIVDWPGKTGKAYRYWQLHDCTPERIQAVAGNYAFVKPLPNGRFLPIYFGVAEDLRARIPNHERWAEAAKLGATFVMTHTTPAGEQARLAEERDLIQYWNPSLNTQHRSVG